MTENLWRNMDIFVNTTAVSTSRETRRPTHAPSGKGCPPALARSGTKKPPRAVSLPLETVLFSEYMSFADVVN